MSEEIWQKYLTKKTQDTGPKVLVQGNIYVINSNSILSKNYWQCVYKIFVTKHKQNNINLIELHSIYEGQMNNVTFPYIMSVVIEPSCFIALFSRVLFFQRETRLLRIEEEQNA